MPDNIYPDLSNDKFDIPYARLLGLSSDLQASIVTGETGSDPIIKQPDDDSTGFMRFGVAAEDDTAGENRSFDLNGGFRFELTQLGNPVFLVDPPNGVYQLGAIPVPGSDSGLSYTYLEVNDTDKKILLQAPEGIVATGYGYGNHSGTATYNLAVDAGGNIIEVAAAGGSGTVNSGLFRKAAYYITDPSGTIVDDWIGVEFGNTNVNTKITAQASTEIPLQIFGAAFQSANLFEINANGGSGGNRLFVESDGSMRIAGELRINITDQGNYKFQMDGDAIQYGSTSDGSATIHRWNSASGGFRMWLWSDGHLGFNSSAHPDATITILDETVPIIFRPTGSTGYSRLQARNDINSVSRSLDLGYTGSGYSNFWLSGYSGEQGVLGTTGAYPLTIGINNTQAAIFTSAGNFELTGTLKIGSVSQDDTEGKVLVWNSTDKVVEWRDAGTLGGGISGITADMGITANTSTNVRLGSANTSGVPLTEDRYINTSTFQLIAQGSSTATSGSDMGVMQINNTTTGIGLYAFSTGGIPVFCDAFDATTNNIATGLRINRSGAGTPASGYGGELRYTINTNSVSQVFAGRMAVIWTNATNGSQTSQWIVTSVTDADSHDSLVLAGAQSTLLSRDAGTNQTAERFSVAGTYKTLTESAATSFVRVNIPTGTATGGEILITVEANDATDYQSRTLRFIWSAVNKAGTITATVQTPEEAVAVSTGTLTVTIDTNDAGSGNLDFRANAVSSLTQTILRCSYQVFKNIGTGAITPQ